MNNLFAKHSGRFCFLQIYNNTASEKLQNYRIAFDFYNIHGAAKKFGASKELIRCHVAQGLYFFNRMK